MYMNIRNVSRRGFLKTSLQAGVLAAGSQLLITRGLFAQDKISANSKINVGVIGLGKMANGHIGGLITTSVCRVTAVCDVDDERVAYNKKRIEEHYTKQSGVSAEGTVKGYKDFRELLADPSIDAVFVVTPDHWHAIISILAARAGKAVYCEKPLTFTVQEGAQVIKAVNENGVVFQTGSQQRSEASFRWLAQTVQSGLIGEVKEVYCEFGRKYPLMLNWPIEETPKGIDWNMWVGPAPYRPYSSHLLPRLMGSTKADEAPKPYGHQWGEWRWHAEYGNGLQADWGAHHLDITLWCLGMDGKGPKYVEVFDNVNPDNPADNRIIGYTFENGIKVRYGFPKELLPLTKESYMVTVVGTNGTAAASRSGKMWASNPALLTAKLPIDKLPVYTSTNHKDNFFNAIRYNQPTICPAEVGVASCNMCLIGNIAHMLGRSLAYDWKTQSFGNDKEANAYLWRANRGEWAKV